MTAITITNAEATVTEAVRASLRAATVDGVAVFKQATIMGSEDAAYEKRLTGDGPMAIVIFEGIEETPGIVTNTTPEAMIELSLLLVLMARVEPSRDEGDKLTAMLRLCNAAKNVIEADRATLATAAGIANLGCAVEDVYHPGIRWDSPDIDATEIVKSPWAVVRQRLTIGYTLDDATSH